MWAVTAGAFSFDWNVSAWVEFNAPPVTIWVILEQNSFVPVSFVVWTVLLFKQLRQYNLLNNLFIYLLIYLL